MPTRLLSPGYQEFDANGKPAPGALLYTYEAGTSTPKVTYSDAGLTIPNANPVEADAGGRFGPVFAEAGDYRLIMKTAAEVTLWTADPVDGAAGSSVTPGAGIRNVLINGDFSVNQRNSATVADDAYSLDRWYALTQTSTITVTQQTLQENGSPTNIRLTQSQATPQRMGLAQIVEAANCRFTRGGSVTLSGRVRCSVSTTIYYAILAWIGTADAPTSDVVNDWTSASYTAGGFFNSTTLAVAAVGSVTPSAASWTSIPALTATVSGSMNNLIVMFWTGAAQAQNVTLDIARAQLEPGVAATEFERLQADRVLAACQRRFFRLGSPFIVYGVASAAGHLAVLDIAFPVTMGAPPHTMTLGSFSSVNNATNGRFAFGGFVDGTQVAVDSIAAGAVSVILNPGSAFDAEL